MIGILGGIVLLYLAFIEYKNYGKEIEYKSESTNTTSFITGVTMSSLNPYFIVWWLATGFHLVNQSAMFGVYGLLLFILARELCDFFWLGFISATSNKTAYMWGDRAYKTLSAISISIFIVFGVYFVLTGVNTFFQEFF